MPGVAAPIIAAIITAGAGAVETGLSLSNQPGQPKQAAPPPPPTNAQIQNKAALAAQGSQGPTLQSQLGGAVSPEYYAQMIDVLKGLVGQPGTGQTGANSLFGIGSGSGTPTGLTAGGTSGLTPPPQENILGGA